MAVLAPALPKVSGQSRRGALHHSLLRQSGNGVGRPGRSRSLWRDRAVGDRMHSTCRVTFTPGSGMWPQDIASQLASIEPRRMRRSGRERHHGRATLLRLSALCLYPERTGHTRERGAEATFRALADAHRGDARHGEPAYGGHGSLLPRQACRSSTRWRCGTGKRRPRWSRRRARRLRSRR